jgi:hypothetical protein
MKKTLFFLSILCFQFFNISATHAFDYDCTDFGSQERAQFEFDRAKYVYNEKGWVIQDNVDTYGIDRDSDGIACDQNPKSKTGMAWLAGLGVLAGLIGVETKEKGVFETSYLFNFDNLLVALATWWIPYVVMAFFRSHLLSAQMAPTTLFVLTFTFSASVVFALSSIIRKRG